MENKRAIDLDPNLRMSNEWQESYKILDKYGYVEGRGNGPIILIHLSSGLCVEDEIKLKELGWNIRKEMKLWKTVEYW